MESNFNCTECHSGQLQPLYLQKQNFSNIQGNINQKFVKQCNRTTYEVDPQHPAYLFGKHVVRPAIDNVCNLGTRIFRGGYSLYRSIDSMLSNFVTFPGAYAQPLQKVAEKNQMASLIVDNPISELQKKISKIVSESIKQFDNKDRNSILSDSKVMENYNVIQGEITSLGTPYANLLEKYLALKSKLQRTCKKDTHIGKIFESLQRLDLAAEEGSNYVLNAKNYILKKGDFFKKNGAIVAPTDLSPEEMDRISEKCNHDFLIKRLMSSFAETRIHVTSLENLIDKDPQTISLQELKDIFSDDMVKKIQERISKIKEAFENDFINFANEVTEQKCSTDALADRIEQLFQSHTDFVNEANSHLWSQKLEIVDETENGQAKRWKVLLKTKENWWWQEEKVKEVELFSFKMTE